MAMSLLSFDNEVFAHYAFYTGAVSLKMLFMGLWTSKRRISNRSFANPEDIGPKDRERVRTRFDDDRVERVRRNHLNDLENIPLYAITGFLYVLTDPTPKVALWHFRAFAIARFLHTISYQSGVQPWRALCHTVGAGVTVSMIIQIMRAAKW